MTRRGFLSLVGAVPLAAAAPRVASRIYHVVDIPDFATCAQTHVQTTGLVAYLAREDDGDRHIRIVNSWPPEDDTPFIVCEIIPSLPVGLKRPLRVGDTITVRGIRRFDDEDAPGHHHYEIHPVEQLTIVELSR